MAEQELKSALDDIDDLVAIKIMGYEFDGAHWVAYQDEKVRHWKIRVSELGEHKFEYREFRPSSRIKDAWAVVEKMREGIEFQMSDWWRDDIVQYRVIFTKHDKLVGQAVAPTAPKAICFAALAALGVPLTKT